MPLIGFLLISIFQLKEMLAIGLLLVGCSPGGTASNVICYLAKGDVALSISVTTCSTLLSVFLTPLLFLFYTGNTIETPVIDMMVTITKIVLIPVGLGMLLNNFNVSLIKKIKIYLPLIAVFSIVFIIAIIIGSNANQITKYGFGIFSVVVLHNILGFFSGYYSSYFLGLNKITCKTLAIEIAMQNSGLATALAFKYFGSLSSLPGAIFSIFHNISGSVIATYWQKNPNN
jgi:BASS family bile acid:Na+ symporter